MDAKTMVFIYGGLSYQVAESIEEATERWREASQARIDDKAMPVELTNVHPYTGDDYPLVFAAGAITHLEVLHPLHLRYAKVKAAEQWGAFEREEAADGTGFGA